VVDHRPRRDDGLRDRPQGRWHLAVRDGHPDRVEVGFHGEFREILPDERIVATEAYEGIPDPDGNASLNTLTLTEQDGRTTMTVLVEHPTAEGRDAHINSGMEAGMQDALDLLEQVAVSLR